MGEDGEKGSEAVSANARLSVSSVTATGTGCVKMQFAVQHLLAATRLVRDILSLETANVGHPASSFLDDIVGASCGVVMLAVASLEAYANEVFDGRLQHFPTYPASLIDLLWEQFERHNPRDKFQLAAELCGRQLDAGDNPVQSLDCLCALRNGIVHFKPAWFGDAPAHEKLSKQLEYRAVRSAWLPEEPLFPRAWASHGTAMWAVQTVTGFAQHFSSVSGLPDPYLQFAAKACSLTTHAG